MQFIIDRRDLLVPQNIREVKGSFFTPKIWADKSKEYMASVFGNNWQDEYYIWDCAAGTGNLLAGLTNKYNLWASDIEQGNVETMQSLIDIDDNLNLLSSHIFQFDFLNDSFDNLPEGLLEIINDSDKRKKLIIHINPPYAENGAGVGKGAGKAGVSSESRIYNKYTESLGRASRELFTQFFIRIYYEIPDCKIAAFGKLKYINAPNFEKFGNLFKSEYKKGVVCRANTFDNVAGNFPISFLIWNLEEKKPITSIECDVLNNKGNIEGKKTYHSHNKKKYINHWINEFNEKSNIIGTLFYNSNDFQHQKFTYLSLAKDALSISAFPININNLYEACIYFSVRLCIDVSWLNDRDQFLFPNDKYKSDNVFKNNCLIFSLFHSQNRIQSSNAVVNHWIPYTEEEVNAKDKFKSKIINSFIKDIKFSSEAQSVLEKGKELWKYYHSKIANNRTVSVDASFYDIREFFQGRDDSGKMNSKSSDDTYNTLISELRSAQKTLALKIQPKVYEFGFLVE